MSPIPQIERLKKISNEITEFLQQEKGYHSGSTTRNYFKSK